MSSDILIIEDNTELRGNLETVLVSQGFTVTAIGCADEFYRIISGNIFDVAIVDISLPDKDDFEIVRYLSKSTKSKVIILSARESVEDRVKGYGAGADIYFVKPVESAELIATIKSILDKKRLEPAQTTIVDRWRIDQNNRILIAPNQSMMFLTSKEWKFLDTILNERGAVVSRDKVMDVLDYKSEKNENNNSLDVLVARIRKKCLEKCNMELPVKTLRDHGYLFHENWDT